MRGKNIDTARKIHSLPVQKEISIYKKFGIPVHTPITGSQGESHMKRQGMFAGKFELNP